MRGALVPGVIVGGRFRLDRPLGEGGMGEVWAATHTLTRRAVALKFVKATGDVARRRSIREAIAATAVRHRSVVQIHDVLEHDALPVLVMDLLDGETLEATLGRLGPRPLGDVADVMVPVVSAVGTAHAAGIIHRDLKPANILLTTAGEPIVLDFGIAKILEDIEEGDAEPSSTLTRTDAKPGTPRYMAPEQWLGESLDHRVDVWALGLVLYECLSGDLPTRGKNLGQVMRAALAGTMPPIERVVPSLPPDVAATVMQMLRRRDVRPDLARVLRVLAPYTHVRAAEFGAARVLGVAAGDVTRDAQGDAAVPGAPSVDDTLLDGPASERTDEPVSAPAAPPPVARAPRRPVLVAVAAVLLLIALAVPALRPLRDAGTPSSPPASAVAPPSIAVARPEAHVEPSASPSATTPLPPAPPPRALASAPPSAVPAPPRRATPILRAPTRAAPSPPNGAPILD